MRSDGSLMSEQFARLHPVETLLCGPAASVMGGFGLTDEKNAVIVDMGGTTTDIAVVVDGIPVRAGDGVSIGKWRTYVNGLMIRTFGLGGDSAVRYRDRKLVLEEFRAIPLCVAAARWPQIGTRLQQLVDEGKIVHSHFRHEFYALAKEPDLARLTEEERALCRAPRRRAAHSGRRGGRDGERSVYFPHSPPVEGGDRAGDRTDAHGRDARARGFRAVRRFRFPAWRRKSWRAIWRSRPNNSANGYTRKYAIRCT